MGWVWRDDNISEYGGDGSFSGNVRGRSDASGSDNGWPTSKVEKSQCRTEELEPGKFIRKCENIKQVFRNCAGKFELVQSNTEHTEEDVTNKILRGSNNAFDFPGLQSDIDAIGRSMFGGVDRFLQAADDIKNGFFNILDHPRSYNSDPPSVGRGIPIEGSPRDEMQECKSGEFDVDELAKDV